ncbi:hypothetical protein L7F22_052167 [Adiantum nelumboides]|nr:hypothetical protein [Adiantum nelumboides]
MLSHSHSATSTLLPTISSTSSTCSSDRHTLRKGSCTGLFFQLFDWNGRLHKKQRLRRKSLPAERPASPSLRDQNGKCTKSSPDQDLNVSDLHTHANNPLQSEQAPPEKKKKKRSPNVVAKLMGLETMPSPDFRREKWSATYVHHSRSPLRVQKHEERSILSHSRIPSSRRSLLEIRGSNMDKASSRWGSVAPCLSEGPSSMRYHDDAVDNSGDSDAPVCKESERASRSSASSIQDSRTGCILLPSNMHNKLILPVKSPLASKARTHLFEAANRLVESNRQFKMAFNESGDGNKENENENATRKELNFKQASNSSASLCPYVQKPLSPPPLKRNKEGGYGSASSSHVARGKQRALSFSAVAVNNKEVQAVQHFHKGHDIHEDVDFSNCQQNHPVIGYGKEGKAKPHLQREKQICRQPNEGVSVKVQNVPPAKGKRESRAPSSHKIRGTLPEQQGESQGASASTSSRSTQLSISTSSGVIVKNKGIPSSRRANSYKKDMMSSNRDIPKTESSSRRNPVSTRVAGAVSKSAVTPNISLGNKSVSQKLHPAKETVCADRLDPICEDDPPTELLSCNIQNSEGVDDASTLYQKECLFPTSVVVVSDNLTTLKFTSTSNILDSGCGGSCISSVDQLRDTATSYETDGSQRRKQTVSYSGKSTATILQELLSALNQSARPLLVENDANSELSEITSRTSQTGECRSMEESIKENCFHSYFNKEEDSGAVPNGHNLLLGICKDNQQHTSLDTMNYAQERQAQSSGCKPNKRKGELIQKVMIDFTNYVFQSEEDYVKCIIHNSKLIPEWGSSTNKFKIDSALFEELETTATHDWALKWLPEMELENWSALNEKWYENLMRGHQKLVFDCVEEALNLDVGISQNSACWMTAPYVDASQSQMYCQRVMKHLKKWQNLRCGMNVDDLVEKDMNTGSGKWDNFSNEFMGIAEQVGHMLVDDLIDELVLGFSSSSHQQAVNARSVTKSSFERSGRKALIWVGL